MSRHVTLAKLILLEVIFMILLGLYVRIGADNLLFYVCYYVFLQYTSVRFTQ